MKNKRESHETDQTPNKSTQPFLRYSSKETEYKVSLIRGGGKVKRGDACVAAADMMFV